MYYRNLLTRTLLLGVTCALLSGNASAALHLRIELNPTPVRPAEVLLAELTVTNDGGTAVTAVTLEATVPTGVNSLSVAAASPTATCLQNNTSGACDPGERVKWDLGTITAGGGITVSLPMVASAVPAGTVITLAGNLLVNAVSNQTANATATVSTTNALSLSVDDDKDPVPPGGRLTFTLTFGNRDATATVTGTTLSFPVPAGTTFESATGGGVLTSNVVNWALGNLLATQSDERQVVVTVNAGTAAGSVLAVDAAVIAGTTLVAESAQARSMTRVAANPPLGLAIDLNPDPVRPGEQLTAQLTVTNRSGAALTGVVLQMRVPGGVNSYSPAAMTFGATCIHVNTSGNCDPTELANWNLGTIPTGAGVTVSVPMTVASATAAGRLISLEALARDDGANRAVAEDTTAVDSNNPLSLSVVENQNPVAAGSNLTYTLTYANRGATTSIDPTTLRFPVPAGTSFVSASGSGALSGGYVEWALGSLPATQSNEQQVVVAVDAALANGTLLAVNSASVSGIGLNAESARATAISRVAENPPLRLAIEMNPDPVRPAELLTAQLTLSNTGGVPLTGVVLQARMPQGVNSIAIASATGGATCVQVNTSGNCDWTELVTWTIGTIPAGGGATLSLPMTALAATQGRLITLEALARGDGVNHAVTEETVAVDGDDPIVLAVDEDKNPVLPGDTLTYTLTYANRATTSSVTGTTLRFPVPKHTTFVSATGGGTLIDGSVEWSIGSLPATQADQQQVVVTVGVDTPAGTPLVVNAGQLAGDDLFPEAARANAVTRVAAVAPLELAIEANPDPVRPGELLITEITVSNRGAAPLTGVVLQTRVPQGVNSYSPAAMTLGGTCIHVNTSGNCDFTELANWNLGTIAAGKGVTVSMPMIASTATSAGQLITLEAVARDDGVNRAVLQQTLAADSNNPLTLIVNESTDAVAVGNVLTYTLTFGNRATTGSATDSTLSFRLPEGTVLLGSPGLTAGGRVSWNLGSVAAGTGGRRRVSVLVPASVPAGSLIRMDAAEFKGNVLTGQVPDAARAVVATRVSTDKPLGLTLMVTPDPVQATQTLTAALTVTNNSGGPLTGVVMQARVPQSVNSFGPGALTGGGTCIHINTSGNCDFNELANWNIGTLAAGASVMVSMPMVVTSGTANGRLITVESLVRDDTGTLATMERTVLLTPFTDTDGDGVAQVFDNCLAVANANQRDTDYDNYGNACDADIFVPNNCSVNFADLATLKAAFLATPASPDWNPDADFNGDGSVNFGDLAFVKSSFFNGPNPGPGPSGVSNTCETG